MLIPASAYPSHGPLPSTLIILSVWLCASSFVPESSSGISRPFWWPVMDGLMFQPSLVAGPGGGKQVMDQLEDGILEGKFKLYFRIISCHRPLLHIPFVI